jgi:valyl-tRNA synthetase
MHLEGYDYKGTSTETLDLWIHTRLARTIKEATEAFDKYEYSRAKQAIEAFFWKDFCDNYLELIKTRMYEPKTPQHKKSAQHALYVSLSAIVRLMAPFTPFITEEVYRLHLKEHEKYPSVHLSKWPELPATNEKSEQAGNIAVAVLAAIRKKKSEMKLSMKAPVKKLVIDTKIDISGVLEDLKATAAAEKLELGKGTEELTPDVKITVEF